MIQSLTSKINNSGYPQLFGGTQIVIPEIFLKCLKQTNSDTVFQTVCLYFWRGEKHLFCKIITQNQCCQFEQNIGRNCSFFFFFFFI